MFTGNVSAVVVASALNLSVEYTDSAPVILMARNINYY